MPTQTHSHQTTWTEDQVRRLVASGDYAYQRLELPYGQIIDGDDRRGTCAQIFPDDLAGQSVLDIGCQNGFFCFEAIKRGAGRVVGCDVNPQCIERARVLADCLGLADRVEFHVLDVEKQPIDERFDLVLCLNVTHHLLDPIAVIEKLANTARHQLILELAGLGRKDRKRLGINRLTAMLLRRLPVMLVGDTGFCSRHHHRGYLISPPAVRNMLTMHRNSCARVDAIASGFKDRDIVIAHKRRIKHLVVIAGASCGGKSHLIDAIQGRSGAVDPEIASLLAKTDMRDWPVVIAGRAHKLNQPQMEGVILEYNAMHILFGSAKHYDRDETLQLIDCADRVTALSLWTPPNVLLEHLEKRHQQTVNKTDADDFALQHARLKELYEKPQALRAQYQQWLEFADRRFDHHTIVSLFDSPKLQTTAQWLANATNQAAKPLAV